MKKVFLTSLFTALSVFGLYAIDWNVTENLAEGKEVIVSSTREGNSENITNGSGDWSAKKPADESGVNWIIVDLGTSQNFTDIEINWHRNHPVAFNVYVSEIPFVYSPVYDEDDNSTFLYNYIDPQNLPEKPVTNGGTEEYPDDAFTENITFEQVSGRYILIYGVEFNGWARDWGTGISQIKVANIEAREEISNISTPENLRLVNHVKTPFTVYFLNSAGEAIFDFSKVRSLELISNDEEALTIEKGSNINEFYITPNSTGNYKLNATAEIEGLEGELTAVTSLIVSVNWEETQNIATGMRIIGRELDSDSNEFPPKFANDGNQETYYTYDGDWGGGESWLIIDLEGEYIVDAVEVLYGEKSGGSYAVAFGNIDSVIPEDRTQNFAFDNKENNWNVTSSLSRTSNDINSYVLDTPVVANYVAVWDKANPNGKPQYREIYISGIKYEGPKPTSVKILADENYLTVGESTKLTGVVYDQYGMTLDLAGIEIYHAGELLNTPDSNNCTVTATEIGNFVYSVVYGSGASRITSEFTLYVLGDNESMLNDKNVLSYTTTIDGEEFVEYDFIKGGGGYQNAAVFDLNNVLRIDFAEKALDLSLIKLRWEAACPSTYSVKAVYNDGDDSEVEIFSIEGRPFGGNVTDRIYSPVETMRYAKRHAAAGNASLQNIKALEIIPTEKDHNWGLRLYGIDLYGTQGQEITTVVNILSETENLSPEYYTLDGRKVNSANIGKGIYIKVVGNNVSKIIL